MHCALFFVHSIFFLKPMPPPILEYVFWFLDYILNISFFQTYFLHVYYIPSTIKRRIIFKEMNCCTVTNQVFEQIIPQIKFVSINWHDFKRCWNGKHTGVILIDLQKAFGTLDHKILWSKMKCDRFFRWNNKTVSLLSHK